MLFYNTQVYFISSTIGQIIQYQENKNEIILDVIKLPVFNQIVLYTKQSEDMFIKKINFLMGGLQAIRTNKDMLKKNKYLKQKKKLLNFKMIVLLLRVKYQLNNIWKLKNLKSFLYFKYFMILLLKQTICNKYYLSFSSIKEKQRLNRRFLKILRPIFKNRLFNRTLFNCNTKRKKLRLKLNKSAIVMPYLPLTTRVIILKSFYYVQKIKSTTNNKLYNLYTFFVLNKSKNKTKQKNKLITYCSKLKYKNLLRYKKKITFFFNTNKKQFDLFVKSFKRQNLANLFKNNVLGYRLKKKLLCTSKVWPRFIYYNYLPRLLWLNDLYTISERQSNKLIVNTSSKNLNLNHIIYRKKGLLLSKLTAQPIIKIMKSTLILQIFNLLKFDKFLNYMSLRTAIRNELRSIELKITKLHNFYKYRPKLFNKSKNKKEQEIILQRYQYNYQLGFKKNKLFKQRLHLFKSLFCNERKILKVFNSRWEKILMKRFPIKIKKYKSLFFFPRIANYNYLYKNQLKAQKRFRWLFRLNLKQLISLYRKSRIGNKNRTEFIFVKYLVLRFDVILYRLNFVSSLREARLVIKKGLYLVNGKTLTWHKYLLNIGDIIKPSEQIQLFKPYMYFWPFDYGQSLINFRLFFRTVQPEHYSSHFFINERVPVAIIINNPSLSGQYFVKPLNLQFLIMSLLRYN